MHELVSEAFKEKSLDKIQELASFDKEDDTTIVSLINLALKDLSNIEQKDLKKRKKKNRFLEDASKTLENSHPISSDFIKKTLDKIKGIEEVFDEILKKLEKAKITKNTAWEIIKYKDDQEKSLKDRFITHHQNKKNTYELINKKKEL